VPTFRDHALGRRDTQEDKGREGDRQGSAGVEENNRELVHGGLRSLDPTAAMLRLIG
jgi:hypothetical protein